MNSRVKAMDENDENEHGEFTVHKFIKKIVSQRNLCSLTTKWNPSIYNLLNFVKSH